MAEESKARVYESRWGEAEQYPPLEERALGDFPDTLVTLSDPTSATAAAYHTLSTNLRHALLDARLSRIVMLTSPDFGAGKTTVCANLGVALAKAGNNVLVIDCDLHKSAVHKAFGLRNVEGLENVLAGERELREVMQEPLPGLGVVTAGPAQPYPAELLDSGRFTRFLRQVSDDFDYVLIDSPPMATTPDPLVLAAQADGVLLVLNLRTTRKEDVRQAVDNLEGIQANLLGTVVNNAKADK